MKDFAKLICEYSSLLSMKVNNKKLTKEKLINEFLISNVQDLYDKLSNDILMANLKEEHFYRFEIQVHAQKKDDIK